MKSVMLSILFFSTCACSQNSYDKTIMPITPDEGVRIFFETYLPVSALDKSDCFFVNINKDTCCLINSLEEFQKISSCVELPTIRFDLYSLIVGQKKVPNSFYSVQEQKVIESDRLILDVSLYLGESHWPAFSTIYHWGIYPKLPNKKLEVTYKY